MPYVAFLTMIALQNCHMCCNQITLTTMAQAGSTFVLNPRRSNSFCRRGASVEGNSDACALGATSRSPFTPRMAYLSGWFVIRMSTNDTGAGRGAFDFFPQRGTAADSTSKRKELLGFLGGRAVHIDS
jgi:hypothetical protein